MEIRTDIVNSIKSVSSRVISILNQSLPRYHLFFSTPEKRMATLKPFPEIEARSNMIVKRDHSREKRQLYVK